MSSRISGLTYPRRKAAHERSETTWPPAYQGPTRRRSSRAIIAPASSVRAPTYTSVLFHIPMGTDREGFEPSIPLRAYRFSRPAVSTAHPPVQLIRGRAAEGIRVVGGELLMPQTSHPLSLSASQPLGLSGQGGIRTHVTVAR